MIADVRNVQKTGNMHYVYLPTSWCKQHNISSDSKVMVDMNNDGTLSISPEIKKQEQKEINLHISEVDKDVIVKLIMACYVNPTNAFKIKVEKPINLTKLLTEKNLISALEFVELDKSQISYESSMSINDPDSLIKTMVRKIRNLLNIMVTHYNTDLIEKYEEEIDRSKTLIEKSVIAALTLSEPSTLKSIELYYISSISRYLERVVDSVILLEKKDTSFLKLLTPIMDMIGTLLDDISTLDYKKTIVLSKKILAIREQKVENINVYNKHRIRSNLVNVADVFLDWSITKEIERTK